MRITMLRQAIECNTTSGIVHNAPCMESAWVRQRGSLNVTTWAPLGNSGSECTAGDPIGCFTVGPADPSTERGHQSDQCALITKNCTRHANVHRTAFFFERPGRFCSRAVHEIRAGSKYKEHKRTSDA